MSPTPCDVAVDTNDRVASLGMEIRELQGADVDGWIGLRCRLWPSADRADLAAEIVEWARGRTGVFVADVDGELVGFAEVTMRDRADGCATSPVGYLEGWWVAEGHRRRGIGSGLVAAAEAWARDRRAVEFASDAHADNDTSIAAHVANGFIAEAPVTRFAKRLEESTGEADGAAPAPDAPITLREIDDDNVRAVTDLDVSPHQRAFVAPNALSLAQYGVTTKAWTRAVYAVDTPVGYVLLSDDDVRERYYLWRFMIDRRYQGRGYGAAALDLVVAYVKSRPGAKGLFTSYVPLSGGPGPFYHRRGFVDTGVEDDGELESFLAF